MILVDTNVWSETTKPRKDPVVDGWLIENEARLALSTIVIAEIRFGIEQSASDRQRSELETWLASLEARFADRILGFDSRAAHAFGILAAARMRRLIETKILDLQLAAQALALNLPVATRNLQDFQWTGVQVINPWQG